MEYLILLFPSLRKHSCQQISLELASTLNQHLQVVIWLLFCFHFRFRTSFQYLKRSKMEDQATLELHEVYKIYIERLIKLNTNLYFYK